MRVVVLGGGRVGSAIARDLAADEGFEVTVADRSEAALARFASEPHVGCQQADLAQPDVVRQVVGEHDLVVQAVPGAIGFVTLRTVLECGRNVVDISFFPENALDLDPLARERQAIAVVDVGIAPGCSNLILGRLERELDEVDRFVCYVGGLPLIRTWPYEFRASFSPFDVIEEYVRPARLVVGGRIVTRPALSDAELIDLPAIGTLEAFNTDGLRTLLHTSKVPDMVEKTLRYPGHREKMQMLRESGFFSPQPLAVGEISVRPLDLTARLLFPMWQYAEEEEDLTVMRILVDGRKGGRRRRYRYDLLDRYDQRTRTSSMARTTGYTCTAVVRLVAEGRYSAVGVSPPELVGREAECYERVIADLAARGVVLEEQIEDLGESA